MHVTRLLWLGLLAHECCGDIMSIGDNMYPYVSLLEPGVPVIWHHKFWAQRMAASQAVRINARGIRFISSQYSVLSIDSTASRWMRVRCTSSTDCLCVLDTPAGFHARFLPNYGENVYSSLGTRDDLEDSLKKIIFSECPEASTGRLVPSSIPLKMLKNAY
jgi:hypothetical protein